MDFEKGLGCSLEKVSGSVLRNQEGFINRVSFSRQTNDEALIELAPVLERLPSLKAVDLPQTNVTKNGLEALANLAKKKNLTFLDMRRNNIDDGNLRLFKDCVSLETLNLQGNKITNKGADEVIRLMKNLKVLILSGNREISNEGVQAISKIETLEEIDLGMTKVDDVGLGLLAGKRNLKVLWAFGSKITDDGINSFNKARAKFGLSEVKINPQ